MNNLTDANHRNTYQSYLLRCWCAEEPGTPWRAMLESVTEPGKRHFFKDLQSLVSYLEIQNNPGEGE